MLLYINWKNHTILTEEEFEKRITNNFNNGKYDDWFEEYLEYHYAPLELFDLWDSDKDDIRNKFRDECFENLMQEGDSDFEPCEI